MKNSLNLRTITEEEKTKEICLAALLEDFKAFSLVPRKLITPEFVIELVQKSSTKAISYLPKEYRTNSFYLQLVELYPDIIWAIPRKNLTAKIGKMAIQKMGYEKTADAVKETPVLLSRLHASLYDHDACLYFVKSRYFKKHCGKRNSGFNTDEDCEKGRLYLNDEFTETFSLPDIMRWEDVCHVIVSLDGSLIKYAPLDVITAKICREAIDHSRFCVDIPDSFKTKEMLLYAFSKNPEYIISMPEEFVNEEIASAAVEHSGFLLRYVPERLRTKDICMIAVKSGNDGLLKNVPSNVLDAEICLTWLKHVKRVVQPLKQIPKSLWNYDICLAAVKIDGDELGRIPKEYIDGAMCLAAVRETAAAAKNIPAEIFTKEMAELVVSDSGVWFEYIPKRLLTEELCILAIRWGDHYSRTALRFVPEEIKTQKMCDLAVKRSPWSLQDVPEKYVTYEMLLEVAQTAPGRLEDNFPNRFRTSETIRKLIDEAPDAEEYIRKLL